MDEMKYNLRRKQKLYCKPSVRSPSATKKFGHYFEMFINTYLKPCQHLLFVINQKKIQSFSHKTFYETLGRNWFTIFEFQNKQQKQPPRVFLKKGILKCSQNSQENRSQPVTLLNKRLWHGCFSVNFEKFLRANFYRTAIGNCF